MASTDFMPGHLLVAISRGEGNVQLTSVAWLLISVAVLVVLNLLRGKAIWLAVGDDFANIPLAPGSHWFFGHLKRMLEDPSGFPAREWINSVPNNGMIRYHMWFKTRILVTKPETLAEVLTVRNHDFVKSRLVRNSLIRVTGEGLVLQEGEVHKMQRKALMPAFSYGHVKSLYPVFWTKASELVRHLERVSDSGAPVEISEWIHRASLDIIGLGGMGRDFNALDQPGNELAEAYNQLFGRSKSSEAADSRLQLLGLIFPFWLIARVPLKTNREINQASRFIRQVCLDMIAQERQRALTSADQGCGLDILSVALGCGGLSDLQLVDHVMTFLTAGHETISVGVTSAIILLCQHPHVQSRLRDEVRRHIPPVSTRIDPADIDTCHYLQAVCLEVLRIWPPITMTFRTAVRDTTIGGEFVPRGSSIVLCPWAVNASKELWGDDAEEFKPERWLDANGRASQSGGASSNHSFLSFLHGPRACIGKRFAMAEFASLVAALIGTFEVEFEKGSALAVGDVVWEGTASVHAKGGVKCTLRKIPGWERMS